MRRISTVQPIHLYNLEPIICGSKKSTMFRTAQISYLYLCLNEGVTHRNTLVFKSKRKLSFGLSLDNTKSAAGGVL